MTNDNAKDNILAIRTRNPSASASDIAKELGISRQYVYVVFKEVGLRTDVGGYRPRKVISAPPAARVVTGGILVRISHTTAGTIGELLVAADLMARGFNVFHPLVRSKALCDLIAQNRQTGALERIEVRCGSRRAGYIHANKSADTSKYDRFAIVMTGEVVKYIPPFSGDSDRDSQYPP